MHEQTRQRRLARRPVRCPEAVTARERDTFLGELLIDARTRKGLQMGSVLDKRNPIKGRMGSKTHDGDHITQSTAKRRVQSITIQRAQL